MKFPALNGRWESLNVSGLFFAGSASHSRDHKRAAGGFLHGFRYTARSLYRTLLMKYEGKEWEATRRYSFAKEDVAKMEEHMMYRINNADGPYQVNS